MVKKKSTKERRKGYLRREEDDLLGTLLTPEEVAAWLKVSKRKVYDMKEKGLIPSLMPGGMIRFSAKALLQWQENGCPPNKELTNVVHVEASNGHVHKNVGTELLWEKYYSATKNPVANLARDGKLMFISRTTAGLDRRSLVGKTVYDYIPEKYQWPMHQALERAYSGEACFLTIEVIGSKGPVWFVARFEPHFQKGEVSTVWVIGTPLSEPPKKHMRATLVF